jgi:hypothetical protein
METAMVADYHNWKKRQPIEHRILIKLFRLFGVYFSGYNDGWKAALELVESRKDFAQQPLSGSPECSPKSAEPTSDNGKRCKKCCAESL